MRILQIISRLMDYPAIEIQQNSADIQSLIDEAREISPALRSELNALLDYLIDSDLMDTQSYYGELFDRGRSLSLLLFEHVHGESRDRGQAMVDLMSVYQEHGFNISAKELPDYIPLYLEYLAQRPEMEAREGLADVCHILGMLSARLQERESPFSVLFDALLVISGQTVDVEKLREAAAKEERDDTPEALDKIWEEEAAFGNDQTTDGSCPSQLEGRGPGLAKEEAATAIHWVDAAHSTKSVPTASTSADAQQ